MEVKKEKLDEVKAKILEHKAVVGADFNEVVVQQVMENVDGEVKPWNRIAVYFFRVPLEEGFSLVPIFIYADIVNNAPASFVAGYCLAVFLEQVMQENDLTVTK